MWGGESGWLNTLWLEEQYTISLQNFLPLIVGTASLCLCSAHWGRFLAYGIGRVTWELSKVHLSFLWDSCLPNLAGYALKSQQSNSFFTDWSLELGRSKPQTW